MALQVQTESMVLTELMEQPDLKATLEIPELVVQLEQQVQ
jgi:ABC-type cobalamin/Fe3+-siderophores transport system ATPase subunit